MGKRNTFCFDVFILDLSPLLRDRAAAVPRHDDPAVGY
jgi:hypothetical protein